MAMAMGSVATAIGIAGPVILALMGVGITVWAPSIVQQHASDAAQDDLKQSINDLKKAVEALTKPLPTPQVVEPARNPDGIYQNNTLVGTVVAPRITLNESRVYFDELLNAANLDTKRPFEYRDLILRMISAGGYIGMLVTNEGVATNVYRNVVCEIVGRRTR
jgi:hypothetical protein